MCGCVSVGRLEVHRDSILANIARFPGNNIDSHIALQAAARGHPLRWLADSPRRILQFSRELWTAELLRREAARADWRSFRQKTV